MPRRKKQRSRLRTWARRLAIVCAGLVVLSFALVLPLRWLNPATTAFMLQDDSGRVPVMHAWVGWEQMGTAAAIAVVAAEDQKFADHSGFDFVSIRAAIENRADGGNLRGASTISQQVVKNLYLWRGRSFVRKGIEAWLTLVLELSLPKQRILEIYLNIAELGAGVYGVGAASDYYFSKSPAQLTDRDAALFAAVLPNPHRMQIERPSPYLRDRQSWILGQMQRLRREQWLTRL